MATEKIAFDLSVSGGENLEKVNKSLADYKKEIKALKNLALNGDGQAAKKVAELQDKLEDLNDATKSVKGDGIEPLVGSFALFKDGLATGDLDKAKLGLKGLGSAMSAIPILLLVEGFKFLVDNFKDVVEVGKVLFNLFSDEEKAVKKLSFELENQKKVTASLVSELGRELALMEAQGLSGEKLLAKKKEIIEAQIKEAEATVRLNFAKLKEARANDTISESYLGIAASIARKLGQDEYAEKLEKQIQAEKSERTQKDLEEFNTSIELVKDLRNKEVVEVAKFETEKRKEYKETSKLQAELLKQFNENNQIIKDETLKKTKESFNENVKNDNLEFEAVELKNQGLQGISEKYDQLDKERLNQSLDYFKKIEEEKVTASIDLSQRSLQSAQSLSDAFFAVKLSKVKKGSTEEEALAKRQFEINKKFQIAMTIAQGFQNAITAYGAGVKAASATGIGAPIVGAAYAALSGIATLSAVAKIASTQFQSSSAGGASIGGGGSASIPSGQIQPPQNLNAPPTTTFTGNNNNNYNPQPIIKAVVIETENRSATNRINKLTNEASF